MTVSCELPRQFRLRADATFSQLKPRSLFAPQLHNNRQASTLRHLQPFQRVNRVSSDWHDLSIRLSHARFFILSETHITGYQRG